jgi:hypothetical protein
MGGGGGGRRLNPREIRRLEEVAKQSLKSADGSTKQNVFLSFVEEDLDDVNLLRGQAKNEKSDIEFNDWSVKEPFESEKAEYIKRQIRERIRQSSVVLVYVSDKTASSKWVDWEIQEGLALGKRVIAMHKSGPPPKKLPKAITDHKIPVVPWNQESLMDAMKGEKK